jgi:hypothetical protein
LIRLRAQWRAAATGAVFQRCLPAFQFGKTGINPSSFDAFFRRARRHAMTAQVGDCIGQ